MPYHSATDPFSIQFQFIYLSSLRSLCPSPRNRCARVCRAAEKSWRRLSPMEVLPTAAVIFSLADPEFAAAARILCIDDNDDREWASRSRLIAPAPPAAVRGPTNVVYDGSSLVFLAFVDVLSEGTIDTNVLWGLILMLLWSNRNIMWNIWIVKQIKQIMFGF